MGNQTLQNDKLKVLIIKLGYSEVLDSEMELVPSLGDVLRSTVILHAYKDAHVSWLVDEKAAPLLKDNPYINRIFIYDLTSVLQLKSERFDTVINLEKVPGICAFSDTVTAWRRYGFRFDPNTGTALPYDGAQKVIDISFDKNTKKRNKKYWEEIVFEMIGLRWEGERLILGYKPRGSVLYDIGFNHAVGEKWPNKAWPMDYWKRLECMLGDKYTISWQKGLKHLEEYIEWINSCRMLVTNDSLGLHIAEALGKKIVALFGPTLESEVFVRTGRKLLPESDYDCIPCLDSSCFQEVPCMHLITPERVYDIIESVLKE